MSRSALAAAVIAGVGVAATPALAIDEFFPTFGNTGYDVSHYDIALDVDSVKNTIDAVTRINLTAERTLGVFTLDLAGLTVSSVKVDGLPAKFTRARDKLIVTSPYTIVRGREATVTVAYSGSPVPIQDPTAPGDPDYVLGWMHYKKAAYALSEPVGASTFFPANDEPTDRASFRFRITVDKPFTAVANGALAEVETVGKRRVFTWVMSQPMTTWLATVHVNTFRFAKATSSKGTPVRVYTTPSTASADVKGYLKAAAMIDWLEPLIGPYPFASYGSVTVDDPALYYALETQGMSTFPTGAADDSVIVHELAHQWFGDSVSVAEWRDLWLAEGFATYIETLWPHRDDPAGFDAAMASLYDFAKEKKLGPAVVSTGPDIFSNRTYVRGALSLYALRQQVGDKTFFEILRSWATWFRNQSVTTQDFIDTAVLISGDEAVRPLLTKWLYKTPLPPFPGASTTAAATAAASKASVSNLVALRCGLGRARGADAASCVR